MRRRNLAALTWLWVVLAGSPVAADPATCSLRAQDLTAVPDLQAYSACTSLDLSSNGLTLLAPGAFAAVAAVTALLLSDNSIAALDPGALSGLTALQVGQAFVIVQWVEVKVLCGCGGQVGGLK